MRLSVLFSTFFLWPALAVAAGAPEPTVKVNAGDLGILLKGYGGYGQNFAILSTATTYSSALDSSGNGFAAGISPLLSWRFLAFEPGFNFYSYSKVISSVTGSNGVTSSTALPGSGNVLTFDAKGGFKLFTEANDMGYTYLYGGLRYWSANPTVAGVTTSIDGTGWVAGFRDYSTFRISGSYAISLTTGIWVSSAPAKSFTTGGVTTNLPNPTGIGVGYELMLGLAIEDIGLAVDAGIRADLFLTQSSATNTTFSAFGYYGVYAFGSGTYVLQLSYAIR